MSRLGRAVSGGMIPFSICLSSARHPPEITMDQKNEISPGGKALRAHEGSPEGVLKQEMERTKDEDINSSVTPTEGMKI